MREAVLEGVTPEFPAHPCALTPDLGRITPALLFVRGRG